MILSVAALLATLFLPVDGGYTDIPCQWKSLTGSTFDLRPLTLTDKATKSQCYYIKDGDIPCTPEIERSYSYVWNFCADVTTACFPTNVCKSSQMGSVLQYYHRDSDGYEECNVIGHYDPSRDDTYYSLLDERDPSRGVSMKYIFGDKCPSGKLRSATLDVQCANVRFEVESALEPTQCEYHMVMKSYHGCPLECPVSSGGLCNSHGHCSYDPAIKQPRCFCNEGYSGDGCTSKSSSSSSSKSSGSSNLSVQIGLMATLLVIALVLIGIMGYISQQINTFRKEQQYASVSQSMEMIDRPF